MSSQPPTSTPTSTPPASTPTPPPSQSSPSSAPPNTSSAPPTSNSSSSSPSSSSSSSSSSSTSLTSTSSTSQGPEVSTSLSQFLSTSGDQVVTRTSTAIVSGTRPVGPASTTASASSSKPFFKNTGAVAGVFTVVGLIALALVFAFITNIVRRRRAKAFDRELQEATREAAAAPAPAFLDDDDDGYGPHGVGSTGAYSSGYVASSNERQFSDLSHGTYGQNPMGHAETYNMRELGPGAGVGEIYDPYAGAAAGAAGGAAGIGIARARSMKSDNSAGNSYGAALADGASPYAAFAGPQGGYNNAPPMPGAGMGGGDPFGATAAQKNLELLEAAGMGAHIAGAGAGTVGALSRSQSQYRDQQPGYGYPQQQQHPQTAQRLSTQSPNDYLALERNRSLGSSGHSHEPSPNSASTGATQYYSPGVVSPYANTIQAHAQQSYQSQIQQPPQQRWSVVNEDPEDAYGGYSPPPGVPAPGALPNPFAGATSTDSHTKEWDRESRASSYSQEEPKRVLKVANE